MRDLNPVTSMVMVMAAAQALNGTKPMNPEELNMLKRTAQKNTINKNTIYKPL